MIGKGDPTIGNNPKTIIMFTTTYKKGCRKTIAVKLSKLLLVMLPILIILEIIKAYRNKIIMIQKSKFFGK